MSDPVLDIESQETFSLVELIDIAYLGETKHRLTFGTSDVEYDGELYLATPGRRGTTPVAQINKDTELEIVLPINHAFVRRYLRNLMPPTSITVRVRRLYETGDIETVFVGEIASLGIDDNNTEATFRAAIVANDAARRLLPVLSLGRSCPYTLYGPGCLVDENGSGPTGLAFKVLTSVLHADGRDVRVDLGNTARNGDWAKSGRLRVISGDAATELVAIRSQTDLNPGSSAVAVLTLAHVIPGLKVGDTVEILAGCDHTIDGTHGCDAKFGNKDNFGGSPAMPSDNPFRWVR